MNNKLDPMALDIELIDSCINNVLYWDREGDGETSRESQLLGETAAEGHPAVSRG
jgi:hypothetical protein